MKKVIALMENGNRVLTSRETAEKNNWWITHNLEVDILPQTITSFNVSLDPDNGNTLLGSNNRYYRVAKSEKVLICRVCHERAKFRIGNCFYCKKHFKHFTFKKP
jgi:hypothetical protein